MIPYATPELFSQDSVEKQLVISFTGGSFTNSDIETESFEWNDPMCSAEQLEFGECCASSVKFNIGIGSVPMEGKELTITITPNGGDPVALGKFKVWSDVPTADRRWRTIEAYDAMADILNTECVSWYDALFPVGTETYTVKQFRDSFFTFLGITQETVTLINDSETVAKTISTTSLSGKDVITSICQMNAVFGKIARDGKFKYVDLATFGETLYPAEDLYPADDLYPAENTNVTELGENGTYLSCEYEDYVTDFIDKVQIRQQENDIGVIVGTGTNAFIIENNFLLFGKGSLVLTPIATAIYNHISGMYFQPAKMVTVGNPLMETGDGIRLWTKYAMIDTYILNRKMTGIQSLRDSIEAKSTKLRSEQLNDTHHELIQLMGKSNTLTRTIEETVSTVEHIIDPLDPTSLQSQITQNAEAIQLKVSKGEVSSEISQEAGQITISSNRLVINSTGFTLDAQGRATFGSETTDNKIDILDANDSSNYAIRVQTKATRPNPDGSTTPAAWFDSFSVEKNGDVNVEGDLNARWIKSDYATIDTLWGDDIQISSNTESYIGKLNVGSLKLNNTSVSLLTSQNVCTWSTNSDYIYGFDMLTSGNFYYDTSDYTWKLKFYSLPTIKHAVVPTLDAWNYVG